VPVCRLGGGEVSWPIRPAAAPNGGGFPQIAPAPSAPPVSPALCHHVFVPWVRSRPRSLRALDACMSTAAVSRIILRQKMLPISDKRKEWLIRRLPSGTVERPVRGTHGAAVAVRRKGSALHDGIGAGRHGVGRWALIHGRSATQRQYRLFSCLAIPVTRTQREDWPEASLGFPIQHVHSWSVAANL
jgi:hypothetical protein